MLTYVIRFIKRFAILIPGVVITYFSVNNLYPFIDELLPRSVAILATYALIAYIFIPTALRVIRIFIRPRHIPLYCTTPDGFACDPVNVGVLGTHDELVQAMQKAGWFVADQRNPKTILKMVWSIVFDKPYPTAPFSSLYLFGRKQDIGFQLPVENNPSYRHHVRFWAATYTPDPRHRDHVSFWQKFLTKPSLPNRILWVGAASQDMGVRPIRHNAQLTHMIHPDTNAERNLIVKQLKATKLVKHTRKITVGKPYRLTNRVLGGYMHADGKMTICEL